MILHGTPCDSFMHNHQSALDSQREDDAIQYLQDCGVYPAILVRVDLLTDIQFMLMM